MGQGRKLYFIMKNQKSILLTAILAIFLGSIFLLKAPIELCNNSNIEYFYSIEVLKVDGEGGFFEVNNHQELANYLSEQKMRRINVILPKENINFTGKIIFLNGKSCLITIYIGNYNYVVKDEKRYKFVDEDLVVEYLNDFLDENMSVKKYYSL